MSKAPKFGLFSAQKGTQPFINSELKLIHICVDVQQCVERMVWTPAHTAARDGDIKRLKRCLGQIPWLQPIDINSQTLSGHTALHMSAANGHLEAMQFILSQKGIDKNPCTLMGNTPLHLAALNNRAPACKLLVNNGVDLNCKNNVGKTAAEVCPPGAEEIRDMLFDAAIERERRVDVDEV